MNIINRALVLRLLAAWQLALVSGFSGFWAVSLEPSAQIFDKVRLVPDGPPLQVVPAGSIVFVQIKSPKSLVSNFDQLIRNMLPPRLAEMPELREVLGSSSPCLTLLGLKGFGKPIQWEDLQETTGIDFGGRFWLALYPGSPVSSFIFSIPIANWDRFAIWLCGLAGSVPEEAQLESELKALQVNGIRIRLKEGETEGIAIQPLFLLCSSREAYVTGEAALVKLLAKSLPQSRISAEPYLSEAFSRIVEQDLGLIIDSKLVRLCSMQAGILKLGLGSGLELARIRMLDHLQERTRKALDMLSIQWFGVKDFAELTGYGVAVLQGTIDYAVDRIASSAAAIEAISVSGKLDAQYQEVSLRVYSSTPAGQQRSVSRGEVRQVVELAGGQAPWIEVNGRRQRTLEFDLAQQWVRHVQYRLSSRGLESGFFRRLSLALSQMRKIPQPIDRAELEAIVAKFSASLPDLTEEDTLGRYPGGKLWERLFGFTTFHLLKGLDMDGFENLLQEQISCSKLSKEALAQLLLTGDRFPPGLHVDYELKKLGPRGGVVSYQQDTLIQTDFGLFGYSHHTLICSRLYHVHPVDGWLALECRREPSDVFINLGRNKAAVIPALEALLERMPEAADQIVIWRFVPCIVDIADRLRAIEQLGRSELDSYLQQCQKAAEGVDESQLVDAVRGIPMPRFAVALCRDRQTGGFYLILPGHIRYPRPAIMPILEELVSDYRSVSQRVGGLLYYKRTQGPETIYSMIQNLDGLAKLIRLVGNRVLDLLADQQRLQEVKALLVQPGDKDPKWIDEMVIGNPKWVMVWFPLLAHGEAEEPSQSSQ